MDDDGVATGFPEHGTVNRTPGRLLPEQLDYAPEPILIADDDRTYVDVNEAAAKILGGTREKTVGRRIDDFFSLGDNQPIPDVWKKFVAAGEQYGTVKLRKAPGSIFAYRCKANYKPGLHMAMLWQIK